MWKNLISVVSGAISGIGLYIVVGLASLAIGSYSAYSWTSDYYQAKINHASLLAEKEKDDIQRKGDELVADYIKQIDQLANHNANLQRQIAVATVHRDGSTCVVSDGFVRLYNASTTGATTTPSSTDGASSGIDEATVLQVAIENNEKYLKLAKQLADLQEFEKSK
jgi:hypothetical protein